jgi:hypothetical protein
MNRTSLLSYGLVLTALFALSARAADNTWTNPAGGTWESANWSDGAVPDSTDTVKIGNSGTYTVTLGSSAVNTAPLSLTNAALQVHSLGSGTPTLDITFTNAAILKINGIFQLGNGIVNMNIPNGQIAASSFYVNGGLGTVGTFNALAGKLVAQGSLTPFLGSAAGNISTINVSTGATLILNSNNARIGNNGTGIININGGSVSLGGLSLGHSGTGTGIVNLTSGSLILTNPGSPTFGIGSGLVDSANHGHGEVNLYGGTIYNAGTQISVGSGVSGAGGGGRGFLRVFGGAHTNDSAILVGGANNSTGTVIIGGGQWTAGSTWNIGLGTNALGTVTITGGVYRARFNSGGNTLIGASTDSHGELNIAGGEYLLTNTLGATAEAFISVGSGAGAIGRMTVSGGRAAILNSGGLFLGTGNSAYGATTTNTTGTAEVLLTGGRLEIKNLVGVGVGVLSNRTGGLLQFVGSDTVIGDPSRFVVDGGTLSYRNYTALNVTGAVAKFSVVSGSGLELDNSTNVNIAGTYLLTNAPGSFKSLSLTGAGPRWQSDALQIASDARLVVSNASNARVRAVVQNDGQISVRGSATFESNVTVTASGGLDGDSGDTFDFRKSLLIQSSNGAGFELASSRVLFSGGGNHTNSITGLDRGTNTFVGDFAYGKLSITNTTDHIYFTSGGGSEPTNALYVWSMDLLGSTNNVANLHAPTSINIYYVLSEHNPFNSYLLDQTYVLDGGGLLLPAVPEPGALALAWIAGLLLWKTRRK